MDAPTPPQSHKNTSAVPLRKETVRISLKPKPGTGAPAPAIPRPPVAATSAPVPVGAKTVPLKRTPPPSTPSGTATASLPQATVKLGGKPAGASKPSAQAKPTTSRLTQETQDAPEVPVALSALVLVLSLGVLGLELWTYLIPK